MTFSTQPPTKPGPFLWRHDSNCHAIPALITIEDGRPYAWSQKGDWYADEVGGEWCELVPKSDLDAAIEAKHQSDRKLISEVDRLNREIEKLRVEVRLAFSEASSDNETLTNEMWRLSRAKRVSEGK